MLPTFNRAEVSNEQEVKGLRASYIRMERGRTDRNWTTVRRRVRQDPVASSDPIPGHVGLVPSRTDPGTASRRAARAGIPS